MSSFESIDFNKLNEADIREEIIAPLLRLLGYRSSTSNNIIREQPLSLKYPKAFLGRKNPNKDPILRGRADYICEVDEKIRWIIEAKPPNEDISLDDIEQAFTYANHPEVRAVIFCLSNGCEIRVYQTNLGAEASPLLIIPYSEFNGRFDEIENLLSPQSIRREFPIYSIDTGKPLGLGLRSIVRVTGGHLEYTGNNYNLPTLKNFVLAITGGSLERNENNQMIAVLKTLSSFASLQKLFEKIKLSDIEAISEDSVISSNSELPTKFASHQSAIMPMGEKMLDISTWKEIIVPINMTYDIKMVAEGFLKNNVFSGTFNTTIKILEFQEIPLETNGVFEIHIS